MLMIDTVLVELFYGVSVRKDQIVYVKIDEDLFDNWIERDGKKEKKYIVSVKTECFDYAICKKFSDKALAEHNYDRIVNAANGIVENVEVYEKKEIRH